MNAPIPSVWITGASSGIGLALVEALTLAGRPVVATARRQDALAAIHRRLPLAEPLAADITDPDSMERVREHWQRHPLELAILNAGTCEYLDVARFDADLVERVIRTNVVGTARSVEAALPGLRLARARGRKAQLAIVGSSAWWFPFPRAEAYSASKAALASFARSLRADLAAERIHVSLISPGFVETPLTEKNDFAMPFRVGATQAARTIINGLRRNRAEITFPKGFIWTLRALSLLPRSVQDRLAASLSRNAQEVSRT